MDIILKKISINTSNLTSQTIQEMLNFLRKNLHLECSENFDKIIDIFWNHTTTMLSQYDDQLLCSTCLYTLMIVVENEEFYLKKILDILNDIVSLKQKSEADDDKISLGVSLMYGLFQSSYLIQKEKYHELIPKIIHVTFELLTILAYEYSKCTFLAFKIISTFKKIIDTQHQASIFTHKNQVALLNLVNHNWENPITGIRNINRSIFQLLLIVLDKNIYTVMFEEIKHFYWNKAKYFMIAEIVEKMQDNIEIFMVNNNFTEGLIHCLFKPGLISAGSDMYYAVLNKIKSAEEWSNIFLKALIDILVGPTQKAIENFYNYWCLPTLKAFPLLLDILLDELSNASDNDSKLLSCLCIIKQGNKMGLVKKQLPDHEFDMIENCIVVGLEQCNPYIRMTAFDILCVAKGNIFPQNVAYKMVLDYIVYNINSDCTVLRINMINSIGNFLNQLHSDFNVNKMCSEYEDLKQLKGFCTNLQIFIKSSLTLNGNYQRKITTIKIIDFIHKYMNTIVTKKRRSKTENGESLTGMLKRENIWLLSEIDVILKLISLLKDPSDDIRETVFSLLLTYYKQDLIEIDMFNLLLYNATKCMQSKFFYEIDCGKIIFKLIINILLTERVEAQFRNVEDVFNFWYNELNSEFHMKRNVVDSIENGKQLHSILNIIFVVFQSDLKAEQKLPIPKDIILNILLILEEVSNQFQWKEAAAVSSDFAKMSDMVLDLIESSGVNTNSTSDPTNVSGLYQVVLNCLWLNVKLSCELSSLILIQYDDDKEICEKCLNIISHVLETCRHKGAIEAAGAALGACIQHLTRLPVTKETSHLPLSFLERKLNELINESNKMASVTRRGAGLSIMVHKIVSSDSRKGKPLFHHFINVLLSTCEMLNNASVGITINERDLPKAIYIHFLTKIVIDSSLASEMMFYSAKLAELAFGNLTSPYWQIRNAALQLYGALIPKLIGQKKASGSDDETIATVACDEFRTHSPNLWKLIMRQLKNSDTKDIIQDHSNLVPILNILANVAKRYNFQYDLTLQSYNDNELFSVFEKLLESPIYTVRRLVAKCMLNIYSDKSLQTFLLKHDKPSENLLHGVLILMNDYKKENIAFFEVPSLKHKYLNILSNGNQSYLCRALFETVFSLDNIEGKLLTDTLEKTKKYANTPGIFLWSNRRVEIYMKNASWQDIFDNMPILIAFDNIELFIKLLCKKMEAGYYSENILVNIINTLIDLDVANKSCAFWEFLYLTSKIFDLSFLITTPVFQSLLSCKKSSYKRRYCIPFVTRLLARNSLTNTIHLKDMSNMIHSLSDPGLTDIDIRYMAALANNELASAMSNLHDDIKVIAIKSAVILLSDEDEEIRNVATNFCHSIQTLEKLKHPFICLNFILSKSFLESVLNNPSEGIKIIIQDLKHFMKSLNSLKKDVYNPFANDSKNIYFEVDVVGQLLDNLLKYYE